MAKPFLKKKEGSQDRRFHTIKKFASKTQTAKKYLSYYKITFQLSQNSFSANF